MMAFFEGNAYLFSDITCVFVIVFNIFASVQSYPITRIPESVRKEVWSPSDGMSRKEWENCWGLPCTIWEETKLILSQLDQMVGPSHLQMSHDRPTSGLIQIEDILLTPAQAKALVSVLRTSDDQIDAATTTSPLVVSPISLPSGNKSQQHSRSKRKINQDLNTMWSLPIPYKFDGSHSEDQRIRVRNAFKQWEDNTCIRFQEIQQDRNVTKSHIILTKSAQACASFVGRINLPAGRPQMLNLADSCFSKIGVAVHEIGHALGLWHEHQRTDRNDHVNIVFDNIGQWAISNFLMPNSEVVMDYGVPYDVNSVMHYSGDIGSSDPGQITIHTKDPFLQRNIGQRDSLSFLDAKVINLAYCKDICSETLALKCLNGGYLDPNDCSHCRCPDGLAGRQCNESAPSVGGKFSKEITLLDGNTEYITSPGYDEGKEYDIGLQCNYLIKAGSRGILSMEFVDKFSVISPLRTCQHWVEVRYKKDLSLPGPRFCGNSLPQFDVKSESDQVLVMFRSTTEIPTRENRAGFKLRIQSAVSSTGTSLKDVTIDHKH